uniref:Uncharacterized protein n=1 Tax=Haptolina ericina TaxID=156174 RepID=A0A7S3AF23_9EUKA|mmetsp:Transcript_15708/g.35208  ORF Transcript_15708/g.35208 Transcript_15708/m.35208 type:complete len:254 (+) Transcript_15708:69-830(+)
MGCQDMAKELFCTWDGLYRCKKLLNLFIGIMIIIISVFSLINFFKEFDALKVIKSGWNLLFGLLILLHEFHWTAWISRRFGFLTGWFGRGMFFLFVGTSVMGSPPKGKCSSCSDGLNFMSFFVGGCCLAAGCIELVFGHTCSTTNAAQEDEQRGAEGAPGAGGATGPGAGNTQDGGKKGWFKGGAKTADKSGAEPTISVNITPSQAAQGAQWAANNPGTVKAAADAAGSASSASGGGASNPFFGNAHLGPNSR